MSSGASEVRCKVDDWLPIAGVTGRKRGRQYISSNSSTTNTKSVDQDLIRSSVSY